MQKIASAAVTLALAGVMAIPAAAPANAASFSFSYGQQDRFVSDRCSEHPNWRGCADYRRNHSHWDRDDYRQWYSWNRPSIGNVGAGLFGFIAGAAIANSINNSNDDNDWRGSSSYNSHVARCEARYRSYDEESDSFLGYDGYRHRCNL